MGSKRLFVLVLLLGGAAFGLLCSAGRPVADAESSGARPASIKGSVPLASGELRDAVAKIGRGESAGAGVDVVGDSIRVEVIHDLSTGKRRSSSSQHGGVIEGEIEGLVQARVPVDRARSARGRAWHSLPASAARCEHPNRSATQRVQARPKGSVAGVITGQEVAKTNADDWHAAGFTGAGVKIGIVDSFEGNFWSAARLLTERFQSLRVTSVESSLVRLATL